MNNNNNTSDNTTARFVQFRTMLLKEVDEMALDADVSAHRFAQYASPEDNNPDIASRYQFRRINFAQAADVDGDDVSAHRWNL
jgi:hypothetical protein